MGRQIRSDIPRTKEKLTLHWEYLEKFKELDQEHKQKQKTNFDGRHQA